MELTRKLYDLFVEKARQVKVSSLTVGLRYTAVATDDGGTGLAFTFQGQGHCCSHREYRDFEGRSAEALLACIKDPLPLNRSMGLALVNALNCHEAEKLADDASDGAWMDALGIDSGSHVAMVGLFRPLMHKFKERGAEVEVVDEGQRIGHHGSFYERLSTWADSLVLTSTSILNGSTEAVLDRLAPGVPAIMLGPSTPLVVEAFDHLPVRVLAGTVPVEQEAVLKAVRHGQGTPVIHRFSRKVCVYPNVA